MPTAEDILGTRQAALDRIMALSGSDEALMRGATEQRFDRPQSDRPFGTRLGAFGFVSPENIHSMGGDPMADIMSPISTSERGERYFDPMALMGGTAGSAAAAPVVTAGTKALRSQIGKMIAKVKELMAAGKMRQAVAHFEDAKKAVAAAEQKGGFHVGDVEKAKVVLDKAESWLQAKTPIPTKSDVTFSKTQARAKSTATTGTAPTPNPPVRAGGGQQTVPSPGTPGAFYPPPQRPWLGPGAAGRPVPKSEAVGAKPRGATPVGGADVEALAKSLGAKTAAQTGKFRRAWEAARPKGIGGWIGAILTLDLGYNMVKDGLNWALGEKEAEPDGPRPGQTALDALTASDAAVGRRASDVQLLSRGIQERLKADLERDYDPAWFDAVFAGRANNSLFSMVAPQTTRDNLANEVRAAYLSAQSQQPQRQLTDAEMNELER